MGTGSDDPSAFSSRNKNEPTFRNTRTDNVDAGDKADKQAVEGCLPDSDDFNTISNLNLLDKKEHETIIVSDVDESDRVLPANSIEDNGLSECLDSLPITMPTSNLKKMLLVLDLNGLLADIVLCPPKGCKADVKISRKSIFRRPFCHDFLKFCFERFEVGIWSSRMKKNIDGVIDLVMGDMKHKLLFCWDLSRCTLTQFNTLENRHKPLIFKELRKIWDKDDPELPWEKGYYNESNTLLLDDSPYKALINPAHTAIFPYPYQCQDRQDDALGDGGDIRIYLERLTLADNVQKFVEQHPLGQEPINERSESWSFYLKVMSSLRPDHNLISLPA